MKELEEDSASVEVIESELSMLIVDRTVLVLIVVLVSSIEVDTIWEVDSDVKESRDDDSAEVEVSRVLVVLESWVSLTLELLLVVSWELVVVIVVELLVVS